MKCQKNITNYIFNIKIKYMYITDSIIDDDYKGFVIIVDRILNYVIQKVTY